MEKDKNTTENSSASKNYDLKSDAVEALAGADAGETPQFSQEELNKYRSRKGFKIPEPVKVVFIKAWFAGAVCFFFLWGLGTYISSLIDMLFVLAVALGIVTDLLVNNSLRFIEKTPGANDKWLMFPHKGTVSFFLNILYSCVILLCVFVLYNVINLAIVSITGNANTVPLGVEPILFGVFCMAFDMLFVGIKQLCKSILRDAKASARRDEQKS